MWFRKSLAGAILVLATLASGTHAKDIIAASGSLPSKLSILYDDTCEYDPSAGGLPWNGSDRGSGGTTGDADGGGTGGGKPDDDSCG